MNALDCFDLARNGAMAYGRGNGRDMALTIPDTDADRRSVPSDWAARGMPANAICPGLFWLNPPGAGALQDRR